MRVLSKLRCQWKRLTALTTCAAAGTCAGGFAGWLAMVPAKCIQLFNLLRMYRPFGPSILQPLKREEPMYKLAWEIELQVPTNLRFDIVPAYKNYYKSQHIKAFPQHAQNRETENAHFTLSRFCQGRNQHIQNFIEPQILKYITQINNNLHWKTKI